MGESLDERRDLSTEPISMLPSGRFPSWGVHTGDSVTLEPLDAEVHGEDLYRLSHIEPPVENLWTYLPYGPFSSGNAFVSWLRDCSSTSDPMFFAIRGHATGRAAGMASYLNIHPLRGVIEIGHIWFSPLLQNTRRSTEALFLMMRHVMDERGYRRLEWKCDAMNQPSRHAAARLGFRFEGIFLNHTIVKQRNRDTAWFSIIDTEWPAIRANFERWLAADNFDADGKQRSSLGDLNRNRK